MGMSKQGVYNSLVCNIIGSVDYASWDGPDAPFDYNNEISRECYSFESFSLLCPLLAHAQTFPPTLYTNYSSSGRVWSIGDVIISSGCGLVGGH